MTIDPSDLQICAQALKNKGYIVTDRLFPSSLTQQLLNDLKSLQIKKSLIQSTTGRARHLQSDRRGDFIFWLDSTSPAQIQFLKAMEDLRNGLNEHLYLNLREGEFHYAVYPAHTHYDKHRDTFHESDDRTISFLLYMNPTWIAEDGGELHIFSETDEEVVVEKITPAFNRCVLFLSALFPHEVKFTKKERFSVAGWLKKPSGSGF
ncbi:MAG: 2OG-Fe(II) oxygenase [Bdellovibrionales bacterium]|nr:2OG-Fe(II) oxygenase [Bdellovibrionales bacterium]